MSAGHGERLSRKQETAIVALLAEPTIDRAAQAARVSYHTLKSWLRRPSFQAAFRRARAELLERVVSQLLSASTEAVAVLKRNLNCGRPAAEIRAAVAIVQQSLRGVEELDLAAELRELKAIVDQLSSKRGTSYAAPS